MMQSQFALTWDGYHNNICKGFSSLQQNGEFVDMTLAADGHLVKVHQILLALASPYFKELIGSAPCQHPVIFLNNVSHRTLCSLLEYIYTGEVMVPPDNLSTFFDTAKALHIRGLDDMSMGDATLDTTMGLPRLDDDDHQVNVSGTKRVGIPSGDTIENISLPAAARKIQFKHEMSSPAKRMNFNQSPDVSFAELQDVSVQDDIDDDMALSTTSPKADKPHSKLQFTVSNRGSLQVILNRYLYNVHSTARRAGVRRWRCVDYRNNRCKAFIITKGNVVLNRANLHNHSFHDKKILSKIERKAVYSAIDEIEGLQHPHTDGGPVQLLDDAHTSSFNISATGGNS